MSSFLSAAEKIARQRQNVRRNLKKMEGAVELALDGCSLLISSWLVLHRNNISVTVR